jgi:hypothetical protein
MSIQVTPIPRLVTLVAPAFTLSTANAAGSEKTAVASDSTLLAYDATVPTTIATPSTSATSPAAGSSATAARRSHIHGSPAIFDTTVPTTIASGASAATGSSSSSAHRDHTHGMFTAAAGFATVASGSTAIAGHTATQVSTAVMSDAYHYIIWDDSRSSGSAGTMIGAFVQGDETLAATNCSNYERRGDGSTSDKILLTTGEAASQTHVWAVVEIS